MLRVLHEAQGRCRQHRPHLLRHPVLLSYNYMGQHNKSLHIGECLHICEVISGYERYMEV
jgi:hypothetical protein